MSDQADRERESRESDTTKFEDIRREDEAERKRVADDVAGERLQDEQQPDQNES
jgi:hypothetical protein